MNDIFDTIYYYTNGFYSIELDNFLYATEPGYQHIGLCMLISTFILCALYYYLFKPVRKQNFWWFCTMGINAAFNFVFSLWYTATPLINNEVDPNDSWTYLDCFYLGITDIIWSIVFFLCISLVIKWWSPAKYVPFRKF